MKNLRMEIHSCDTGYAQALAEALAMDMPAIEFAVTIAEKDEEAYILVNGKKMPIKDGLMLPCSVRSGIREILTEEEYSGIFRRRHPEKCDIIAVTGAKGGAGATSFAEALAEEFTLYYGRTVLLISFAVFPDEKDNDECDNVQKLLYHIALESGYPEEGCKDMEKYIYEDEKGVFRMCYGESINALSHVSCDENIRFLEYVSGYGSFDSVICDITPALLFDLKDEMQIFEKVISVSLPEGCICDERMEKCFGALDMESRVIHVVNDAHGVSDGGYGDPGEDGGMIYADHDPVSFYGDRVRIDSSFGLAVKSIAFRALFC